MKASRLKRFLVGRGSAAQRAFLAAARLLQLRFPSTLRVDGHLVGARTTDRFLALLLHKLGAADTPEKRVLAERVRPGMRCVDVGANIGVYTLLLARLAGPSGRVWAFEPEPENFALLERNVAQNGYGNVECVRKAVSDRSGAAELGFCEEHRGDHRLFDPDPSHRRVPIETVTLDAFFEPGARIDVLKMDIEGAEVAALEGMRRVIRDNPGIVVIAEYCPDLIESSGFSCESFPVYWRGLGFDALNIDDGMRPAPLEDARAFADMGRACGYANLLLTRP